MASSRLLQSPERHPSAAPGGAVAGTATAETLVAGTLGAFFLLVLFADYDDVECSLAPPRMKLSRKRAES